MTKQSDIEMVAKARAWAVKAHEATALKNTNLRAGPTRCQKTNEAKKATCTNVRTA